MDTVYSSLATRALLKHQSLQDSKQQRRTIVALAGPPGSGKSTLAAAVSNLLNKQKSFNFAVTVPMDGFHLSRSILDSLPNKEEAYARRGAAWTFDAHGVLSLVEALHQSKNDSSKIILAPSFDHVLKDPCADAITITPENSLIILEGNWLLRDEDPWGQISKIVDDTWFVDVDPSLARDRIARRHIESGIEASWEEAVRRVEGNDLPNGEEVRTRLVLPAILVHSVEVSVLTQ